MNVSARAGPDVSSSPAKAAASSPPGQDLEHRLLAGCAIAHAAGALAKRHFKARPRTLQIAFKGEQDYVSATDAEVESLIRERLHAAFPQDSFYGEEGGGAFGQDAWVVDPIDGTANFMRGIPTFCVSMAFLRGGRCEIGIIYDPIHDELLAARRGGGASLNGEPMQVSGLADIREATIEAGWSTRLPPDAYTALVLALKEAGAGVRRGGSGALALAYVAAGRIDGYCELHMNAWDALAGLVLVEEAGGWASDFLGNEGLTRGNPILGCTPALKEALVRATGIAA
jgi:myo-inositol-1(or 4)-monophosphatase